MFFRKILKAVKSCSKSDEFCGFLIQLLGRKPRNKELYSLAFIHKSASIIHNNEKLNNERLEYLGDAILGAVVADVLYTAFPKQKEGFLTKVRANIVSREQLNQIGKQMKFQEHIKTNGCTTDNIIGNTVESLVGAIYIDLGYEKTKAFVINEIIDKHIDIEQLIQQNKNFKSKLLEWGQYEKKEVSFHTIESNTPNTFKTEVIINEDIMGYGEAPSKKKSQQIAAKEALLKVKYRS